MNCMQEDLDAEANFRTKRCKTLADFKQVFHLVDCFRHLHQGPGSTLAIGQGW
jgi:hypothetical protein